MSTQTKKEQEEVKAGEAAGDEQQQGAAAPVPLLPFRPHCPRPKGKFGHCSCCLLL